MKRILELLASFLLALFIFLTVDVIRLVNREGPLIHDALWNFSQASAKVNDASAAQIEHFSNEMRETQKATAAAKNFFDHTDLTVNGRRNDGLIPQITTLVVKAQPAMDNLVLATRHTDEAVQNLNVLLKGSTVTIAELQGAVKQVNDTIRDLDGVVTDPAVKEAIANLAKAAQNAADGTRELAAIAADGRQVADKARETYLKPVNLWWGLVKTLLPLAGSAAQVVK